MFLVLLLYCWELKITFNFFNRNTRFVFCDIVWKMRGWWFNDVSLNDFHIYTRLGTRKIVRVLRIDVTYRCLVLEHIALHGFHLLDCALCNALLVASAVCSCDIDAQASTTVGVSNRLRFTEGVCRKRFAWHACVYDMTIATVRKKKKKNTLRTWN